MRILLFTGKGGVGKSTVAAGTSVLAAAAGRRTLVLSTDAAHSLGDAFGADVGGSPTELAEGLFVQQVDAQARFERSWSEVQRYLMSVLDAVGVEPIAAEELTVLPGAEEVLALLEVRRQVRSGQWDTVVVDCAPTAETLRLLALPEALGWYMRRVFPVQHRLVRTFRPALTRATGVPMPADPVFDAVTRLYRELGEVRSLLTGPRASVRLVLTPEKVVVAEARRSWTSLSLFGYRVDGVVANRVFPAEGADDWRRGWVEAQDQVMTEVAESFEDLPLWRAAYRSSEPVGIGELGRMAADLYAGSDPFAVPGSREAFTMRHVPGGAVLTFALPHVARHDVDLVRHGDDLVVTVAAYRRVVTLPQALARLTVAGARAEDGELQVRFREEAS